MTFALALNPSHCCYSCPAHGLCYSAEGRQAMVCRAYCGYGKGMVNLLAEEPQKHCPKTILPKQTAVPKV